MKNFETRYFSSASQEVERSKNRQNSIIHLGFNPTI